MSLAKRCASSFSTPSKTRGYDYFSYNKVRLIQVAPEYISARVAGSRLYETSLSHDSNVDGLFCHCTCPHYDDGFLCKHLWATILAIDARNLGHLIPGYGMLGVDFEDIVDGGEDSTPHKVQTQKPQIPKTPAWKLQLMQIEKRASRTEATPVAPKADTELHYTLVLDDILREQVLMIQLGRTAIKKNGQPGKIRSLDVYPRELKNLSSQLIHEADRELVDFFRGIRLSRNAHNIDYDYNRICSVVVESSMFKHLLPKFCATGRLTWVKNRSDQTEDRPTLTWDPGKPWRFETKLSRNEEKKVWQMDGFLCRDGERKNITEPKLLLASGVVIFDSTIGLLDAAPSFQWIYLLRQGGSFQIPFSEQDDFVEHIHAMDTTLPVELPAEMQWTVVRPTPQPVISLSSHEYTSTLAGKVSFDYDGERFLFQDNKTTLSDRTQRRILVRQNALEQQRVLELFAAGARVASWGGRDDGNDIELPPNRLHSFVPQLFDKGWSVTAEGKAIRQAAKFSISVTSGIDWFDMSADLRFDEAALALPRILEAVKSGNRFVTLDDGTLGILPEDWLARFTPFGKLGEIEGDKLRFKKSQAAFLDALLAAEPEVTIDKTFARAREKIRSFSKIQKQTPTAGFKGKLRPYQSDGLDWLHYLNNMGLGGCLADDMGLGKTIQVLALLAGLKSKKPSLVVVPRSLVYNWKEESARFSPKLRWLDYTGSERKDALTQTSKSDVIITTYGTMRKDIAVLKEIEFEYVILDEAQSIKNAGSQTAKAVRLLHGEHRLAMTGTPIENRMDDLWSIFEFLNPGMAGHLPQWVDDKAPEFISRALRPFLLRRTKDQVLTELPKKTEQTLYCELGKKERELYTELRDHYRALLTTKIDKTGLRKSKIDVLAALLRLRQAACHPGLINPGMAAAESAKIETLVEQLKDILAEGHKALVFSQFTSLLALVRPRLEKEGIVFEYLDGQTRDRKKCVDRFQTDPKCGVFLISLKAGGLGLNLTAADYIFILDPWWNPAVEAQAMDRAHRIGQTKPVFAYRLIAKDTVEEKILQMQKDKKEIANAILTENNSIIRSLSAEDLMWLLS